MNTKELHDRLALRAASSYRRCGPSAYYFARFKLRYDPFYALLLVERLIPAGARILDLGCAQGLLAAWLAAAQQCYFEGIWASACPAPEAIKSYRGIDRNGSEIRCAQQALGSRVEFLAADILLAQLSEATVIVLLDVLHYLNYEEQLKLLRAIRTALPIDGCLLLRIGDCAGGVRARVSGWVDSLVLRLRGYRKGTIHRRPLTEWLLTLGELGFTAREIAHQRSLGYANVLLRAFPNDPNASQ